jgi:hypothetical protein
MAENIRFDGVNIAWVTVDATAYNEAKAVIGNANTDSAGRERMAVAKMRETAIVCAAPTNASYDVRVTLKNAVTYNADIKTLYPSHGVANANNAAAKSDIWDLIDREHEKEKGQGNICLFDLSYLHAGLRDDTIGGIHNGYPDAITLWYTTDGRDVHVCLPTIDERHYRDRRPI